MIQQSGIETQSQRSKKLSIPRRYGLGGHRRSRPITSADKWSRQSPADQKKVEGLAEKKREKDSPRPCPAEVPPATVTRHALRRVEKSVIGPPRRRSLERRRARRRRRLRAARRGLVLGAVPRTRNGSGRCSGVFDRPTAPTVSH